MYNEGSRQLQDRFRARALADRMVERIVHDTAGRPVEYVRSWYRGNRYEYTVTLDLGPDADANPYVQLA